MKRLIVVLVVILLCLTAGSCDTCPENQELHYQLLCADGTWYGAGGCPLAVGCDCVQYCQ